MPVEALIREGNTIRLLDQTRLPGQLVYKTITDYREMITSIRRLEVRGAPAIGIAAAYGLALAVAARAQISPDYLATVAAELKAARPTAVNLAWAVDRVVARVHSSAVKTREDIMKVLWAEAEKIHTEDRIMCRQMGEYGAALIKPGDNILTHCNAGALATGGLGTALAVIYVAHEQGKKIKVFADETRPLLQGARLTAWELQQAGIDVTLIVDSVAAMLMRQGRVQHVIVGADRIAKNGDTANKIGTYSVAVNAREHGVPFYVAAPASTFDEHIATGADIPIEERAAEEVTEGFGSRTAPGAIPVYAPAFDVTPNEYITAFITDTGIRPGGRA